MTEYIKTLLEEYRWGDKTATKFTVVPFVLED